MARPSAADLPRPLAAVMATVDLRVRSDRASTNISRDFACENVRVCECEVMVGVSVSE